jgi:cytochrome c-type biogenesis protein CcmH/NrfG
LFALLLTLQGEPAAAQADAHARALARAACQSGKQSEAVTDATAAVQRDPNELGPRMRLADALVDQGCYQKAVDVLEAGQQAFPRNRELSGKLRDVRSLVTEQTYIEGLTQAAEGAKFQRNQLRCTRLADVTACEDALKFKPDDEQLLLAKGDALMQGNRPADAAAAYRHASQLKPGDDAVKTKLAAAEALQASATQAAEAASKIAAAGAAPKPPQRTPAAGTVANAGSAASPRAGKNTAAGSAATLAAAGTPARASAIGGQLTATPLATIAALEPQQARTYSNEAPPGRTN